MRRKSNLENVQFHVEERKGPPPIPEKKSGLREGVELDAHEQNYMLPHFTVLIVGKPGSGKTTVLRNLLTSKEFYKKKFDHVLLVSPSASKTDIPIGKENINSQFSISWIEDRLMQFNKKQTERVILRLRDQGIIDRFDVKRLNGHLFDEMATDVTKNKPNEPRNIFEDKQRFFTTGVFTSQKAAKHPGTVVSGEPRTNAESKVNAKTIQYDGKGKVINHVLPQYVDEIHEKYVKRLDVDSRNQLKRNTLIVMDDVVSDIKANEHNPLLTQMIFNRRHLMVNGTVSLAIVSQKYSMIPSRIRSNANWMILFKMNPIDSEAVYKDAVDWPIDLWVRLNQYAFGGIEKKTHNHLDLWIEQGKYFVNFKEVKLNSNSLEHEENAVIPYEQQQQAHPPQTPHQQKKKQEQEPSKEEPDRRHS